MQINLRAVVGLPVVTKSGQKIGRVLDVVLNTDTHAVASYNVRERMFGKEQYVIKPVQVLEIRADGLIVEDAVLKDVVDEVVVKGSATAAWSGAVPRSEE